MMAKGRGNSKKKQAYEAPKEWPADKIVRFRIADLVVYPRNARLHADDQVDKLADAITRFGFTVPVVVDRNGEIICGHGRVMAAKKLGIVEVPGFFRPDDWTDEDVKAYRIWDNQSALLSEWSNEMLRLEIGDLKLSEYPLQVLGFEQYTLDWFSSGAELVEDPSKEWAGMPQFENPDERPYRSIVFHFLKEEDVQALAALIGQKFTADTKYTWFPEIQEKTFVDKMYEQQAAE